MCLIKNKSYKPFNIGGNGMNEKHAKWANLIGEGLIIISTYKKFMAVTTLDEVSAVPGTTIDDREFIEDDIIQNHPNFYPDKDITVRARMMILKNRFGTINRLLVEDHIDPMEWVKE